MIFRIKILIKETKINSSYKLDFILIIVNNKDISLLMNQKLINNVLSKGLLKNKQKNSYNLEEEQDKILPLI